MIPSIASVLLLNLFGIFNLLGTQANLIVNQLVFFVISIAVFFAARAFGKSFFRDNSHIIYWVFVVLLILTFIIGVEARGSKRWISLYFFNFQASEFLKIFFIAYFAHYFTEFRQEAWRLGVFVRSLLYFLIPALIIAAQPDLGNAIVFGVIYLMIVLFSQTPKRYLFYLICIGLLVTPLVFFSLKNYQRARITSFISNSSDQKGASYNMVQALITTGSGKFLGKGLGYGTQSKLLYLPENHTDFAYSALVEQLGLVGGGAVLVLYSILIFSFFRKAASYASYTDKERSYQFLFSVGFITYLFFQIAINIGMNVGLVPVVGIALPFISYGGSSLVSAALGLALFL